MASKSLQEVVSVIPTLPIVYCVLWQCIKTAIRYKTCRSDRSSEEGYSSREEIK